MNPSVLMPIITALLPLLPQMASQLGGVSPGLSGLLNLLHAAQPANVDPAHPANVVQLLQNMLNEAQALGFVSFGAPLVVDGQFGGRTFAAIKAVQTKLGFTVEEPMASTEYKFLQNLVAKL